MSDYLMSNYNPLPVGFTHGEGAWLWDQDNKRYLDALGGIAVCALGHCHPAITKAITKQAQTLIHTSNLYHILNQELLAERLCKITGLDKAFFCNSGAEANEAAIKLSRLHARKRNISEPKIIVMERSFHGRTLATLSATANKKVQAGFEPLVPGFIRAPHNDIAAVENIFNTHPNVVAILVEPITGEGGIHIPDENYLPTLRLLCDKFQALLMLDEIQSGMGRTGAFFAYQHYPDLLPDVLTMAKALGNGIPIGACLAKGAAANYFQAGAHGTTFGGNPFVTGVALAVLDTLEKDHLIERAGVAGAALLELLQQRLQHHPHVKHIRGKGMMLAIELDQPCRDILMLGLKHGILFSVTAESTIRLLPPYIMSDEQLLLLADKLTLTIEEYYTR